jgi:hypothetical protein
MRFLKKSTLVFLVIFTFSSHIKAQFIDSLKMHLSHQPTFFIKLNNRNTFIKNQTARVNGLNIGFSYNNRFRTGIALNHLTSSYTQKNTCNDHTIISHFAISYISYFVDYTYYQKKRLSIAIPLQLGLGMSYYHYSSNNHLWLYSKHYGITYEASTIVNYELFYWISVNGGLGYRLALFDNNEANLHFTSIIYSFGINLYPGRLYKHLFKS